MNDLISPKYQMKLINDIERALWNEFQTSKYYNVEKYLEKWQKWEDRYSDTGFHIGLCPHFDIIKYQKDGNIDLKSTLHNIDGETLLKIAIDLGIDTPDFIPSIPTFKNELKSDYTTAYDAFIKAYNQIETDPSLAIGLANSALESIVKEILKDDRISNSLKGKETLYALIIEILKVFQLFPTAEMPVEIKAIGSSLLVVCQNIEKLRSEKTNLHGKTAEDYVIKDSLYAYFVVNSVTAVGLFINSYYKNKLPKVKNENDIIIDDELPF
jgi:hypothetical protein